MSLNDLPHEHAGLGATFLVLLVVLGTMILIGTVVWLRMAPHGVSSEPGQRPHSELRIGLRTPVASSMLRGPMA